MNPKQSAVIGFASANPHKLRETRECLQQLCPQIQVVSVVPEVPVAETGATFAENALIKLKACLEAQGIPPIVTHVLAEDAGLVVDALDGKYGISPFPGVYSDRWLSPEIQQALFGMVVENLTYVEKNQAILKLMAGVQNRSACYESWLACWSRQTGQIMVEHGVMNLNVAHQTKGALGFGYDPIMIPVANFACQTVAELLADAKNQISHRFQALGKILPFVEQSMATGSASGCSVQSYHPQCEND